MLHAFAYDTAHIDRVRKTLLHCFRLRHGAAGTNSFLCTTGRCFFSLLQKTSMRLCTTRNRRSSRESSVASTTKCRVKEMSRNSKKWFRKTVRLQKQALDKVRKAEYRLERHRKKLEEEQQALELLLEEQTGMPMH